MRGFRRGSRARKRELKISNFENNSNARSISDAYTLVNDRMYKEILLTYIHRLNDFNRRKYISNIWRGRGWKYMTRVRQQYVCTYVRPWKFYIARTPPYTRGNLKFPRGYPASLKIYLHDYQSNIAFLIFSPHSSREVTYLPVRVRRFDAITTIDFRPTRPLPFGGIVKYYFYGMSYTSIRTAAARAVLQISILFFCTSDGFLR